jgi:hypothetical protein
MAREANRSKYCHFQIQCDYPAGAAVLLLKYVSWIVRDQQGFMPRLPLAASWPWRDRRRQGQVVR